MKTALIIIDMQNGFMNENTKHLVPKIVNFVKGQSFDLVIGTRYINTSYTACHIFEGSESAELVPEIESLCNEVVDKHKYSCWGSLLKSILKQHGILWFYFRYFFSQSRYSNFRGMYYQF